MNDHPVLDPSWSSVTIIPNWIQLVTIGGTLERPQDCWSTARWTWDDSKWDVFPGFFQELRKMMITSERTWFQNWEDFVELLFSSFSLRTSFFWVVYYHFSWIPKASISGSCQIFRCEAPAFYWVVWRKNLRSKRCLFACCFWPWNMSGLILPIVQIWECCGWNFAYSTHLTRSSTWWHLVPRSWNSFKQQRVQQK